MKHERNEEFVPFGFSFGVTRNEEDILRILCLPLGVATLQGEDEPKQNEIGHPGQIQCFGYNRTLGAVGKVDNGSYMLIVSCRRCR